ncbi:MAG: phosphoribosylformylglycinamidine synthase subunit PurQ [Myxococcales bacterium]|nr:phosphoribosylformylglycinamidine synthase subunit PurQ [Myxococcales bacterium]
MVHALKSVLGADARLVWHRDAALPAGTQGVLVPGGFSYGDYLRCGAMARFSPVMADVRRFADAGGPVLGTCNGFQVLCEAGLLPGALRRNRDLHFICEDAPLRVERTDTVFTADYAEGEVIRIPIKHGEGMYFAHADELERMEAKRQVVLRYCHPDGRVDEAANPNGSLANVAGIVNEAGNVFGLMPHPEHAVEAALGGTDGARMLRGLVEAGKARGERS